MLFVATVLVSFSPVQQPVTCAITKGTGGEYTLSISGTADKYDTKSCEFSADEPFTSNITTVFDYHGECGRDSWAGCKAYGSAYSFNCACTCNSDAGVPGERACQYSWGGRVNISGEGRNARCSCSK